MGERNLTRTTMGRANISIQGRLKILYEFHVLPKQEDIATTSRSHNFTLAQTSFRYLDGSITMKVMEVQLETSRTLDFVLLQSIHL